MDVLTDDHEREQVVLKWWRENRLSLILGVVIAVGALIGISQYRAYTVRESAQKAYQVYALEAKLAAPGATYKDAENFISEHKDIYGSLLALDLATVQAGRGEFEEALKNTQFAVENGSDLVKPNALLASAKIQLELKKFDAAVKSCEAVTSEAYASEKYELLGDINFAQAKYDAAHDFYKKAIDICVKNRIVINPLLQVKFDNLIKKGDTPAFKEAQALQKAIAESATKIKK